MKLPEVKSYREFLMRYDSGEGENITKKRKQAEVTRDKSQSGYGVTAEGLSEAGLSKSGYASFLDNKAKERYMHTQDEIAEALIEEENRKYTSYEKYLDAMRKEEDGLESKIHRAILSSKTTSFESAMRLAELYGLSGERARASVENALQLNIEKKKHSIMDYIRTQRISPERAVAYGESHGLPKDVVDEIRAFAERLYGVNALRGENEGYGTQNR